MSEKYKVGPRRMWKAEEFDGLKPTVYDWTRIAAFIDGEGNLNINTCGKARRSIVRIIVCNTNAALPVWLEETFGGNVVIRHVKNPRWKTPYIWSCCAARAAWILHNCMPWFLLKQAQAKLLLEMQEHLDETRQGRSRWLTEEKQVLRDAIKENLHRLNAKGPSQSL